MLFDLSFNYLLALAAWMAALAGGFVLLLWLRRHWGAIRHQRVKWANLGLSLWMFLVALTGVELYFAVIYDQSDSFNMTNVSKHWFTRHIKPVQKTLNFNDGQSTVYRDLQAFPTQLADGQQHLCFVGDSFTFGHGVPNCADRFSDRIGVSLERQAPGKFVVSNLADAGLDLNVIAWLIEELARDKLPVDTIVYVMCLNDIEKFNPETEALYREIAARAPQSFLLRDTYFFNLLYYRMQQLQSPRIGGYYSYLQDSYASIAWYKMQAKLDDLRRLCVHSRMQLRVAVFPFLHNLGPDYPFTRAHRQIVEYCEQHDIPVLDLQPVLEPHIAKGLTVSRLDAHPNERAHALAAEAIERELLNNLRVESIDR
ncbi:MAG: SGNH/GDSL hydrolase family protein [Planctomycetaceae bacterium]|nr:SGNH/GDSL hydrolase family protein [Planctomycetaceae bacterium]